MDSEQRQQVLQQVQSANNVLVAVNANPTVDELAASVGLTLALNKLGKHATTVFSGVVPSTIEFLQPESAIETTTDSLRDFIIALDKSKADKLRYKVEDDVVRIFITPYRTTINERDLDFSLGDFNVDVVIALGVNRREDLDRAITAHGRILHDATVVSLTKQNMVSELGAVNWQDPQASSLCEMVAGMLFDMQPDVLDGQMSTALLTGIIAETDRFKNERTTPFALSLSSRLMSSGANQQLIAEKLEEPVAPPAPMMPAHDDLPQVIQEERPAVDGELSIDHDDDEIDRIHIDEHGNLGQSHDEQSAQEMSDVPEMTDDKPAQADPEEPKNEVLSDPGQSLFDDLAKDQEDNAPSPVESGVITSDDPENKPTLQAPESNTPILSHGKTITPPADPDRPQKSDKPFDLQQAMQESGVSSTGVAPEQPSQEQSTVPPPPPMPPLPPTPPAPVAEAPEPAPPPAATSPSEGGDTLSDLEMAVKSPHVSQDYSLEDAKKAVEDAANSQAPQFPAPAQSVGAQPVDLNPPKPLGSTEQEAKDPNAPPPVPPPMTPQFYDADGTNDNPFLNPGQR